MLGVEDKQETCSKSILQNEVLIQYVFGDS